MIDSPRLSKLSGVVPLIFTLKRDILVELCSTITISGHVINIAHIVLIHLALRSFLHRTILFPRDIPARCSTIVTQAESSYDSFRQVALVVTIGSFRDLLLLCIIRTFFLCSFFLLPELGDPWVTLLLHWPS